MLILKWGEKIQIKQEVVTEDLGETQDSYEAGTLLNAFGGGERCKQRC